MKIKKTYKVGDIKKWQGIRNSDTGKIEYGYLWFITKIEDNVTTSKGIKVAGKNRSQAIKNYENNK